jgi:hypothetical protein
VSGLDDLACQAAAVCRYASAATTAADNSGSALGLDPAGADAGFCDGLAGQRAVLAGRCFVDVARGRQGVNACD